MPAPSDSKTSSASYHSRDVWLDFNHACRVIIFVCTCPSFSSIPNDCTMCSILFCFFVVHHLNQMPWEPFCSTLNNTLHYLTNVIMFSYIPTMTLDYNPWTHPNKTQTRPITCIDKVLTLIGTFLTVHRAFLSPTYCCYCSSIQCNNVHT